MLDQQQTVDLKSLCDLKVVLTNCSPKNLVPLPGGVGFSVPTRTVKRISEVASTVPAVDICCRSSSDDHTKNQQARGQGISLHRKSARLAVNVSCCIGCTLKTARARKSTRYKGKLSHLLGKNKKNRKRKGCYISANNQSLARWRTTVQPQEGALSVKEKRLGHQSRVNACPSTVDGGLSPVPYLLACKTTQESTTTTSTWTTTTFEPGAPNVTVLGANAGATELTLSSTSTREISNLGTTPCAAPLPATMAHQVMDSMHGSSLAFSHYALHQGTLLPRYYVVSGPGSSIAESDGTATISRAEIPGHTIQNINTNPVAPDKQMVAICSSNTTGYEGTISRAEIPGHTIQDINTNPVALDKQMVAICSSNTTGYEGTISRAEIPGHVIQYSGSNSEPDGEKMITPLTVDRATYADTISRVLVVPGYTTQSVRVNPVAEGWYTAASGVSHPVISTGQSSRVSEGVVHKPKHVPIILARSNRRRTPIPRIVSCHGSWSLSGTNTYQAVPSSGTANFGPSTVGTAVPETAPVSSSPATCCESRLLQGLTSTAPAELQLFSSAKSAIPMPSVRSARTLSSYSSTGTSVNRSLLRLASRDWTAHQTTDALQDHAYCRPESRTFTETVRNSPSLNVPAVETDEEKFSISSLVAEFIRDRCGGSSSSFENLHSYERSTVEINRMSAEGEGSLEDESLERLQFNTNEKPASVSVAAKAETSASNNFARIQVCNGTDQRTVNVDEICAKLETVLSRIMKRKRMCGTDYSWLVKDLRFSLQNETAIKACDVLASLRSFLQIKKNQLKLSHIKLRGWSKSLREFLDKCKSTTIALEKKYNTDLKKKEVVVADICWLKQRTANNRMTMNRWRREFNELSARKEVLVKGKKLLKTKWPNTGNSE